MTKADGLYELVLTEGLLDELKTLTDYCSQTSVHSEVSHLVLSEVLAKQFAIALQEVDGQGTEKVRRQIELVNSTLTDLGRKIGSQGWLDTLADPAAVLNSIHRRIQPPISPRTGLIQPWLFAAGKDEPSLLSELRREISCCDRVDILVSFIKVAGVRKILDILQSVTAQGADGSSRTQFRIITTTYMGATDPEALDILADLPNSEVKVSLDGRRTRLHAKAWIFHRKTGFGSTYVGSANLSGAALMGGLEWTVKFTENGQSPVYERAKAHFESLWEDPEFQTYERHNVKHRIALREALKRESSSQLIASPTFFDLQPKAYQQEMLVQLDAERREGRVRNLLVAATGTGKTVVAAFDYRQICKQMPGRPRLLFVAHRQEILKQALKTYREILGDNSFGELLIGGSDLANFDHIFATIDSIDSKDLVGRLGAEYWHVVVIDECHRIAGNRFDKFASSISPKVLLGLTATPERSDGQPILHQFHNRADGSPAFELRLWHALDQQLLCPFEYFACDDSTDFSSVPWDQPGELEALDNLVAENEERARLAIAEWRRLSGGIENSKALAFCVSVRHAQFMTRRFNDAGIPALCIVGSTPGDERNSAPARLARNEVRVLVTCDLYNEGVDLPSVNTLLLLRPTQSPVLFQQQMGRGLRLHPSKDSCLILDFVGRHRETFRFDHLFSSITGLSKSQIILAVENGFSSLPPGCHIQLQRQSREQILGNLRKISQNNWRRLKGELQSFVSLKGRTNIQLADFLNAQGIDLEDIYRGANPSGWTTLKCDSGLFGLAASDEIEYYGRRLSDVLHFNDPLRLEHLRSLGSTDSSSPRDRILRQMFAYQIDAGTSAIQSGEEFLAKLRKSPEVITEIRELEVVLRAKTSLAMIPLPGLEDVPLCLHGTYSRREILTAVEYMTSSRRPLAREGVVSLPGKKLDLLFVTLDKSAGFHERVSYNDYAISPSRFHWQSQNSAGPKTEVGKRYINSESSGWRFQLFVRLNPEHPFVACGAVTLDAYEGEKPMTIYWKLEVPLPLIVFHEFSVLRGA